MTVESCVAYCNGQNYIYAGVEYASQCCKLSFSYRFCSFPLFLLTLPFALIRQTVEILLPMAQGLLRVRTAASHVQAMRLRPVVLAIA